MDQVLGKSTPERLLIGALCLMATSLPATEFVLCDAVVTMGGGFWDSGQVMDFNEGHLNRDRPKTCGANRLHQWWQFVPPYGDAGYHSSRPAPSNSADLAWPLLGCPLPMFYGLKDGIQRTRVQERHLLFSKIRNRFTTHPRCPAHGSCVWASKTGRATTLFRVPPSYRSSDGHRIRWPTVRSFSKAVA